MKYGEGDLLWRSGVPDRVEQQLGYVPNQMQTRRESEINPQRTQLVPLQVQLMRTSVIMPLAI